MGKAGFSIIEVLFAVLLFTIMIVGISQLMVSGVGQQTVNAEHQLSLIAVGNITERTLSEIRDNTGPLSPGGGSQGACDSTGKTYESTIDSDAAALLTYSGIPPFIFTSCPDCQVEVKLTCDALKFWNGYVRVRDTDGNQTIATVPVAIYQP
jgi:type II secretory pathway pseudopilin PulG